MPELTPERIANDIHNLLIGLTISRVTSHPQRVKEITDYVIIVTESLRAECSRVSGLANDWEDRLKFKDDEIARLRAESVRIQKIINQCGELSTGWRHGKEGWHLLRINSLLSGNAGADIPDTEEGPWRVGKKVPLNVYAGDRAVCQCHTEHDARRLVEGMNALVAAERRGDTSEVAALKAELKEADTLCRMAHAELDRACDAINEILGPEAKWDDVDTAIKLIGSQYADLKAEIETLRIANDAQRRYYAQKCVEVNNHRDLLQKLREGIETRKNDISPLDMTAYQHGKVTAYSDVLTLLDTLTGKQEPLSDPESSKSDSVESAASDAIRFPISVAAEFGLWNPTYVNDVAELLNAISNALHRSPTSTVRLGLAGLTDSKQHSTTASSTPKEGGDASGEKEPEK